MKVSMMEENEWDFFNVSIFPNFCFYAGKYMMAKKHLYGNMNAYIKSRKAVTATNSTN